MSTFYKQTNPTQTDNVSAGYPINSIWINTITYSGYEQLSDGVWTWSSKYSNTVNNDFFPVLSNYTPIVYYVNSGENVTNVYYVNSGSTSGGTVDINSINIGQISGYSGENFIVINGNGTPKENGQLLKTTYSNAINMTPNGSPLSPYNPLNILLSPGYYEIGDPIRYRVTLSNTNNTPINGNAHIIINTVYGTFEFNDVYENITPYTVLTDLILSCSKGYKLLESLMVIYNDSLPVEDGTDLYLEYVSTCGYGVENSNIGIIILINENAIYNARIEKVSDSVFSLDYDFINIKSLYPNAILETPYAGGNPVINFINVNTQNCCLEGLIIGGDINGNNFGHLRLSDAFFINVHNCYIYRGPGSVFDEFVTGSSVYCTGSYNNCILMQPGVVDGNRNDGEQFVLVVNGTFNNIKSFVGFGVDFYGRSLAISVNGNFKDCAF